MVYVVMAIGRGRPYIVMAYTVMAHVDVAYAVMDYTVRANIVTAYTSVVCEINGPYSSDVSRHGVWGDGLVCSGHRC